MSKCQNVAYDDRGKERKCGDYGISGQLFCDKCMEEIEKQYPQGWQYYPGDVCEHGTYVGGCGIDWMCHKCEMGE